jgi:hypothetical protein
MCWMTVSAAGQVPHGIPSANGVSPNGSTTVTYVSAHTRLVSKPKPPTKDREGFETLDGERAGVCGPER